MRRALLGVALAAVAFTGVATAQNTFCERYSGTTTDAAAQYGLISNVVTRAVLGATAAQTGTTAVTGLVNEPNNRGYFNGTLHPFIDYTNPNNTAQLTTLATHLNQFFAWALGCRAAAGNATYQWTPRQMYALHKPMGITPAIMTAFILEVGTSLASYGVELGAPTNPGTEFAFLGGLLSQFDRYATSLPDTDTSTIFGAGLQICTNAACPLAHSIAQFHVDDSNVLTQPGSTTGTNVTIAQGDYVNFRFPASGGVTQTDSATGTTALPNGLASAANTRTYTVQMNTPGTYYFYANGAASGVKAAITVTGSSSSSTGAWSSSSTGTTGGAAASASLGFATVLAIAAAAAAIVA